MIEHKNHPLGFQLKRCFETRQRIIRLGLRDSDINGVYRSNPGSYEEYFMSVLEGEHLIDFIKNKQSPVVVDLLSTTDAIAGLFEQIPHEKYGLSVSLEEDRDEERLERDSRLGITHLVGDLNDFQTWRKVHEKLAGRKADLIMERGCVALINDLPINGRYYAYTVNNMWKMLSSDNGVIIAEIAHHRKLSDAGIDIDDWTRMLQQHNIDVAYRYGEMREGGGIIKLVKTKTSPEKLPFLP